MSLKIEKDIQSKYFNAVAEGRKTFEIRRDSILYNVGEHLVLREIENGAYTGDFVEAEITYVLRDVPEYGLKPGYCILGIKVIGYVRGIR